MENSIEFNIPDFSTDIDEFILPDNPSPTRFVSLDHLTILDDEEEEDDEVTDGDDSDISQNEEWFVLEIVPTMITQIKQFLYKIFYDRLIDCQICDPQWKKPRSSNSVKNYGYKKAFQSRSIYDGYLYIYYDYTKKDLMEPLIKSISGVKKILGTISQEEMDDVFEKVFSLTSISRVQNDSKVKITPDYLYKVGEKVNVVEGAFAGFNGEVKGIKQNGLIVRVGLVVFNQLETVVEIEASYLVPES